jgi:F-type H+-transporting ATPase subunit delta
LNRSEVSFRYGRALYAIASREKKVESWLKELDEITPFLEDKSRFLYICASPQLDQKTKIGFIERCLGHDADPQLVKFYIFLIEKRRFQFLPAIVAEYQRLAGEELGSLSIDLITSDPIDEEAERKLQTKLEEKLQKKITIRKKIDPTLISGGILMIGNRRIDSSLRGRLLRLRKHLLRGTS